MSVQSKLSKDAKQNVREMIEDFKDQGGRVFFFPSCGLTLAIGPSRTYCGKVSRMSFVGVSWACPTERKFRKMVGAMHALDAHEFKPMQVPVHPEDYAIWAGSFAATFDPMSFDNGARGYDLDSDTEA